MDLTGTYIFNSYRAGENLNTMVGMVIKAKFLTEFCFHHTTTKSKNNQLIYFKKSVEIKSENSDLKLYYRIHDSEKLFILKLKFNPIKACWNGLIKIYINSRKIYENENITMVKVWQ